MNPQKKLKVAVLFGGCSTEHEVSLTSAKFIMQSLDPDKYELIPLYISKKGEWFYYGGELADLSKGHHEGRSCCTPAFMSPDTGKAGVALFEKDGVRFLPVDVVFPVLHGKNGEDGTVQGLAALAKIPMVGCGLLSSALCMDKVMAKIILSAVGIPNAPYYSIKKSALKNIDVHLDEIEQKLGYPIFVKPANAGSSVGVSKAKNREGLKTAIDLAFLHDSKVLCEKAIVGREVECAVFGGEEPFASIPGEIEPGAEFYDYAAKYEDDTSKLYIPARIRPETTEKLREIACRAFVALDCKGLARIDFFVTPEEEVILNEVNTLPGFTPISMYPKLMNECGYPAGVLVDRLIALSLEE